MRSHPTNCWLVLFSGSVQGVGFRYTAVRVANSLGVCGYVRNLPDGRVELVADTDRRTLNRLIDEICERTHGFVSEHNIEALPRSGDYLDFEVRH